MIPEIGRRFGPYQIQSRLGTGGMGHVYRAWDARLHREVAIKLLRSEYAMPGMRERFLREARAASALSHPNICTVFDIGEQDGDPYLVMELLEGETLKDRIQNQTIQVDDLVCIARETAEALGAAHAKGIVHRDIKPANIFLMEKSVSGIQSKVLDFGLAKIEGGVLGARGNRSIDLTSAGSTVGTLAYMSPEQARGESLDLRSDLFSLGVVMYEMATRHIPFQGATSALVFVKLLNHAPEPIRDWNESMPKELERIVTKLMAKDRTARYQTAQELVQALNTFKDKAGTGWLRRAVSTVPLVRAPDPIARERRNQQTQQRRSRSSDNPAESTPNPTPAPDRPSRVTRASSGEPHFLRPVARVPRNDLPRFSSVENTSIRLAAAAAAATATPVPTSATQAPVTPVPELAPSAATLDAVPAPTPLPLAAATGEAPSESPALPAADPAVTGDSGAFAASLPPPLEPGPAEPRARGSMVWWALGAATLVVLAIAVWLILHHGAFSTSLLTNRDPVAVTEIENRTGNAMLDGTVREGLQLALSESPYLLLRSTDSFLIARHLVATADQPATAATARATADRLNARFYLYGYIAHTEAPYLLHAELIENATGRTLSTFEQTAASLQEVPQAVDRLADDLRALTGESTDSIQKNSSPLTQEATYSLEALHALTAGDAAYYEGRSFDALTAYQRAARLDPQFVQAQLRLVEALRRQRAEAAVEQAARRANDASQHTGERTRLLAQFEYDLYASGDYLRALATIRELLTLYPHDSRALESLARCLRLQGHMAEALQAAQQAYAEDPFNIDAYNQAESALLALDRFEGAVQIEQQMQRFGIDHIGGTLAASYLTGQPAAIQAAEAPYRKPGRSPLHPDWTYGLYLDNSGQVAAGTRLWRGRADAALAVPELTSSAASLLAQGALNRALLNDCPLALGMAHDSDRLPQGALALFNSGMASAFCGDQARAREIVARLARDYPRGFAVNGYLVPDLNAAIAMRASDPETALNVLRPARQYDLISLTPYLRGLAHVSLRQLQIGIVDFQTVLAHQGITFAVGSNAYPLSKIGVARAFADIGDNANSADMYRQFLAGWPQADPGQPLLVEARSHIRLNH